VHDLLGGVEASVSLVIEEEDEDEADMSINVARARQEDDDRQEPDDSLLELDGGESGDDGGVYCVNAFMGGGSTREWRRSSSTTRTSVPAERGVWRREARKRDGGHRTCHGCSRRRRTWRKSSI
jgi:hypothetical protein